MRHLTLVLALLLVPVAAHAQEAASQEAASQEAASQEAASQEAASSEQGGIRFFSGSLGAGVSGAGYEVGAYNASLSVALATPRYAFSARYAEVAEANLGIFTPRPLRRLAEVALLAGVRESFAGGWLLARAQAGPGLVFEQRRGAPLPSDCGFGQLFCTQDYETEIGRALGMAGQAELMLTPIPYVGLGVRFAGNVNGARSFGGVSVALHVGRLY